MLENIISEGSSHMRKSIAHTESLLRRLRAGKADVAMLDGIKVAAYGAESPLNSVAGITVSDARTLHIKAWDKSLIPDIEKAITNNPIGLTPRLQDDVLVLHLPQLSEERRSQLVKEARQRIEQGRASLRTIRKELNERLRRHKDEVAEDALRDAENKVQKLTDTHMKELDTLLAAKEKEMTTI